ncbi:MAG TPA: HlyD family secretion protein [Bacteroidales bacterium]|nr:HlyD family secretion protein [Bacteroidales bacterium]
MSNSKLKKSLKVYIPLILVTLGVLIGVMIWYINYTKFIRTDDAHIESDNVSVSSKILGRISKLYAQEGDEVKAGMLLVELDTTDLAAQKQQALAGKAQSEASKVQAEAKYQYDKKNVQVLEISLRRLQEDFERAKNQFAGDVISKEQYDHARNALEIGQAQLDAARSQLQVSLSQISSAEKAIGSSEAQIEVINTQMSNTRLYAPLDGLIAKRWLLAGDIVQPAQSVYTINNDKKYWVMVYLEETKIGHLQIGQRARFSIDAFPGEVFDGAIFSMGSGTASQFSIIPASNASGNFTKVTQRVPLKISIDATESGKALSSYRFLSGMSCLVRIVRK